MVTGTADRRLASRAFARLGAAAVIGMFPGPAGASPGIADLVRVADIDSLALSPDGRHLAFRTVSANLSTNRYDLRWYDLTVDSGMVRLVGGGGDAIYSDPGLIEAERPLWLTGSKQFAVRARIGGATGIWLADLERKALTPLVVRDEDVESVSLAADGRSILYRVGPSRAEIERSERAEYDDGIFVDSSVDLAQNLYRGGWVDGRRATQRLVGYWFVRAGLLWRRPRQTRSYDLSTRTDNPVGPPKPAPSFQPPSLSFAASASSASGDVAEAHWDGRSGSVSAQLRGSSEGLRCPSSSCSSRRVSSLSWRPGGEELLVTFIDRHGGQSLYSWAPRSGAFRAVASSGGLLSGDRRAATPCAVGAAAAYCVAASAASPPRLESIDLGTGKASILFDPNPAWRGSYDPSVERLALRLPGGSVATGLLMTAPGKAARAAPLFVNYYSCEGFLRGGQGDEWPLPQLLDSGFVVACLNAVPFSGAQDAIATYRTGLEAVRTLIGELSRRGVADPKKVAMGGLSFGSEVATWVASRSNLLAALSIASAQSDPSAYWFDSIGSSDRPAKIRQVWGLGRPDETPRRWKLVSAALNAERITAPVLLQLPEQEARRIPQFYARLTQSSTPAELYAYPDEGHIKLQPRHRLAVYQRNLDWFRYWLQDYRDPLGSKLEQYQRWDRLRARRAGASPTMTEARARARRSR